MNSIRLKLAISLFLIVSAIAVYSQVTDQDFITFDDNTYVTENSDIHAGLTKKGLLWALTTFHAGNWHPLTWLSHMLDCQLFGLNPGMHHLTNLLFHIANTLLLFLLLNRMTGTLWRSSFVAALFALHPIHVESVAWISERKDVLSTFFWMLTLWAYVRYVELPCLIRYLFVLIFFVLGLMAKPMLVTLPLVLLLMDYWPLNRLQLTSFKKNGKLPPPKQASFRLIAEKIPFLVFVALLSIVTFLAQDKAVQSLDNFPLMARISNALVSYVTYIRMMFWPEGLAVFYPYPPTIPLWKALGAGLTLICLTGIFIKGARTLPYLAVGWLWYLGTLIPVIGLIQVGNQAMADRYTYIPLIGPFIMITWGIADVLEKWRFRQIFFAISISLVLSALTVRTWLQVKHWKNGITIFEHALNVTANNYLAHNNLGNALVKQGRYEEAITHYSMVLRIKPRHPAAHYNLGVFMGRKGNAKEAIGHYYESLRTNPTNADAHTNLGNILLRQGSAEIAITHYSKALKLEPNNPLFLYNMGVALASLKKLDEASAYYGEALRIKPDFADAHNGLGVALMGKGNLDEAIRHFNKALHIKPEYATVRENLARALKLKEEMTPKPPK